MCFHCVTVTSLGSSTEPGRALRTETRSVQKHTLCFLLRHRDVTGVIQKTRCVTPDRNPLCRKTYTSCHCVIMTSFDPPQKEVWHSEQKPTVCKNKTKNTPYCHCVIVMSLGSSTERGTHGNRLCVRNLYCVVTADIIVTLYQKYTYLCDIYIKIQHLPE